MQSNETTACLVPAHLDLNPFCYQCDNMTRAEDVHRSDPLAKKHTLANGTCENHGYPDFVRNDPILHDVGLYAKKHFLGPTQSIAAINCTTPTGRPLTCPCGHSYECASEWCDGNPPECAKHPSPTPAPGPAPAPNVCGVYGCCAETQADCDNGPAFCTIQSMCSHHGVPCYTRRCKGSNDDDCTC